MSLPKGNVIYQAYPLSFADGNGDGVGDFRGVTQRLPYLQRELGVDGLWLSPFYASPGRDGGYDVSNYFGVNEQLHGPMTDAEHMIAAAKARNFDIIADFVPSHSSDEHPSFQQALQNPNDTRYVFRDGTRPPNNWLRVFPDHTPEPATGEYVASEASAWQPVAEVWPHAHPKRLQQVCLTSFSAHQPNWNLDNHDVVMHHRAALRNWLAKGIAGIRVDAVDYMDHDRAYPDEPVNERYKGGNPYDRLQRKHSMRGPNGLHYLKTLVSVIQEFPNAYMMLESYPDRDVADANPVAHYMRYYREFGKQWPGRVAPFCFEITDLPWEARSFKRAIDSFQAALRPEDIPIYPGGNHDKHRLASRYGARAARAAAVVQLTLPGIAVIYQGDELGMTNHHDIPRDKLTDPFLGRDVARSPLPMNAHDPRAGYSQISPDKFRLPVHPEYRRYNVQSQQEDPQSTWRLYRDAIALRKNTTAIHHGSYEPVESARRVFAFARVGKQRGEHCLTVTNFSDQPTEVALGHMAGQSDIILSSNDRTREGSVLGDRLALAGHEAVVLRPHP